MTLTITQDTVYPTIKIDISDLEARSSLEAVRVIVENKEGLRAIAHLQAHKNGRNQIEYKLTVLKKDSEVSKKATATWVI